MTDPTNKTKIWGWGAVAGVVTFLVLIVLTSYTFWPAILLAILVAVLVAILLWIGFYRDSDTGYGDDVAPRPQVGNVPSGTMASGTTGIAAMPIATDPVPPPATPKTAAAQPAAGSSSAAAVKTSAPAPKAAGSKPAASKAKATAKPAAKAAAKPAKAAAKPAKAAAKPAAKASAKLADKTAIKAAPKPAAKPAAKSSAKSAAKTAAPKPAAAASKTATNTGKPQVLTAARDGRADDLKQIKGVGPKLEGELHKMGVYHFDQIASWKKAEVTWMDENLAGVRQRVSRDGWVKQAKILAEGGTTEFSKRVKEGDVY